jgi:hypothetical protein
LKHLVILLALTTLPNALVAEPLYRNSVASNDLDFILADDPGACWEVAEIGGGRTEMYDPRRDKMMVDGAVHFEASYPNQSIRINVHPAVVDPKARAMQAAESVSRLPQGMRAELRYVNILDGDGGAWAEDEGRFFTLYDGLMTRRLAEHDLDETVFHETAHIALDPIFSSDPGWQAQQFADANFMTRYAAENPTQEDIAETALFVWTMTHHRGRLSAEVEALVQKTIPNRLEYMSNMLEGFEPPRCG